MSNVIARAQPFELTDTEALEQAGRREYTLPIFSKDEPWQMPAGAFGNAACGSV